MTMSCDFHTETESNLIMDQGHHYHEHPPYYCSHNTIFNKDMEGGGVLYMQVGSMELGGSLKTSLKETTFADISTRCSSRLQG